MILPPPTAAAPWIETQTTAPSFDSQIERIAQGDIMIVKVGNDGHSRLSPGDTLIVDKMPESECTERMLLLIEHDGKYIVRPKRLAHSLLQRARLHAVGCDKPNRIRVLGRVIGWLSYE